MMAQTREFPMIHAMISMEVAVVMAISADPYMIEGCQCQSRNLYGKNETDQERKGKMSS